MQYEDSVIFQCYEIADIVLKFENPSRDLTITYTKKSINKHISQTSYK